MRGKSSPEDCKFIERGMASKWFSDRRNRARTTVKLASKWFSDRRNKAHTTVKLASRKRYDRFWHYSVRQA